MCTCTFLLWFCRMTSLFTVYELPRGLLIKGLCPLKEEEKDDEMGRGSDGRKEGGRRESLMLCSSGDQRPQETKGGRISEED